MSLLNFLTTTASAAVLAQSEKLSIQTSIKTLERRLDESFPTGTFVQKFRFGSSTRDTILPRLMDEQSDIDYMLVFSDATFTPSTYLSRLRSFVEARYPNSRIYQAHPTIVLELNHIKFDLVPATRSFWSGLRIPSKQGGWIGTNPNDFNERLERKNVAHGSLIKPAIRLTKLWNARGNFPFESYELEQQITNMSFARPCNLREVFLSIIDSLDPGFFPAQRIKDEMIRARARTAKIRDLERRGEAGLAVLEARRLLRMKSR